MSLDRLSIHDVLEVARQQGVAALDPCGDCSMHPKSCMNDGERALSHDPQEGVAQCLKNRVQVRLNGHRSA